MNGAALSSQNGRPAFLQPSHGHCGPSLQDVAVHQELSAPSSTWSLLQSTQQGKVTGRGAAVGWGSAGVMHSAVGEEGERGTAQPAWMAPSGEMRGFLLGGNVNLCLVGLRASSRGALGASVLL